MDHTLHTTLSRLGFCILTGATPDSFAHCVEKILQKLWIIAEIPDFSLLTTIRALELEHFNCPPINYVWVLNIYLRGAELLFEAGLCPESNIALLRELDFEADAILTRSTDGIVKFGFGPYHFAEWERRQYEKFYEKLLIKKFDTRNNTCMCMALRDFAKKKKDEPDRLFALPSGIHLAYIFGNPKNSHITNTRGSDKRMFYFNSRNAIPELTRVKKEHNLCQMENIHYDGIQALFRTITKILSLSVEKYIYNSCQPEVAASTISAWKPTIRTWKPVVPLSGGWREKAAARELTLQQVDK